MGSFEHTIFYVSLSACFMSVLLCEYIILEFYSVCLELRFSPHICVTVVDANFPSMSS